MARRRTRRNPIRTTGALIINPRRRRRRPTKRRRTRRNALQIRSNRRRRTRRNALQIRTNRRRRSTRKGMVRRTARRAYRPRRRNRRTRRRGGRLSTVRRRRNTRAGGRRKTARRAYRRNRRRAMRGMYAKRRNRRRRRNTARDFISRTSASLAKIPILGGFLSFAPYAAIGAIALEPVMILHQALGSYFKNLPSPLFYGLCGILVAGAIKLLGSIGPVKKMISPYTVDKLAIAAASAAGGVAWYKFRGYNGETVSEEMSGLEIRGYSSPLGLLELRGFSGFGGGASAYGEYGPAAVMPMGTY